MIGLAMVIAMPILVILRGAALQAPLTLLEASPKYIISFAIC